MKKRYLLVSFAILTVLNCCKKNDHVPSTQEKILGKWKILRFVDINEATGAYLSAPYNGAPTDYAEYRADGKLYSYIAGQTDTFTYNIINDQTLVEKNITFQIRSLTDIEFTKSVYIPGTGHTRMEYLYK